LKIKFELASISILTCAHAEKNLHVVYHVVMCILVCSRESSRM